MKAYGLMMALLVGISCDGAKDTAKDRAPEPVAPAAGAEGVATPEAPAAPAATEVAEVAGDGEALPTEAPEENPESATVKLKLDVWPRTAKAMAIWGGKKLGVAPLQFERPRHSGPVEVLIQADGYLDYHTRLYTDRDDKLVIRLVRANEAYTLLGFKRPHDGGVPMGDGGIRVDGGTAPPVDAGASGTASAGPPSDAGAFTVPPSVSF